MIDDENTVRGAFRQLTGFEKLRVAVGLLARGVFWVCFVFILGNAVFQALSEGGAQVVTAIVELMAFPITVLVYPFAAHPGAMAWPFADGTSFIPSWVAMLVSYPVSTFVGGMGPVDVR